MNSSRACREFHPSPGPVFAPPGDWSSTDTVHHGSRLDPWVARPSPGLSKARLSARLLTDRRAWARPACALREKRASRLPPPGCLLWTNTRRRDEPASRYCLRVIASVATGSGLGRAGAGPPLGAVRVRGHRRRTLAQELAGTGEAHAGRDGQKAAFRPPRRHCNPQPPSRKRT
jgi:hypothetical protein